MLRVLITGCCGFIGFHLTNKLLSKNYFVMGIDNMNDYYDVKLKYDRLEILSSYRNFLYKNISIEDVRSVQQVFNQNFDVVINLAAQAGVRYSLKNPMAYIDSNIVGFINVLEACRHNSIKHFIYASSSSVYGANTSLPFSTKQNVDHPISLYAATKKSNELIAHSYSHLFGLPTTGLRFFTVYGPWGRPDMALFKFTKSICEGKPIDVYNYGRMKRDFTYVDDVIEAIERLIHKSPEPNLYWTGECPEPGSSYAPFKIYNIGNNTPVELNRFIDEIENKIGKKAIRNLLPLQAGDVPETYAEISDLENDIGFKPKTPIEVGISNFIDWYLDYYEVRNNE